MSLRFIPPASPRGRDRPPVGDRWVHEVKFDGYRMEVCVDEGATITSRQELDWTHRFPVLAKTFRALPARIIGRGGRVPNRQGDF